MISVRTSCQAIRIDEIPVGCDVLFNGEWHTVLRTARSHTGTGGATRWYAEIGGTRNGRSWSLRLLNYRLVAMKDPEA